MRIMLVNPYNYAHDPGELFYHGRHSTWARGLLELGHEVTILTTREGQGEVIREKTESGLEVIALPRSSFPFLSNCTQYWKDAIHCDVVHFVNSYPQMGSVFIITSLLKICRRPVMIEDATDPWFAASKKATLYALFSSKVPDFFTPISEELRKLYSRFGAPLHKSAVVPNAADTERIRSLEIERARDELRIDKDIFLLGFEWGSFATPLYDTFLFLFHSLREIIDKYPATTLALIGKFSAYRNMIVELAKQFDLNNIVFSGPCGSRELSYWLCSCDVLLLPQGNNLFERTRFPNRFLDYLAAGRPIIVTSSSVTAPIVIEKGCGLVARTNDPKDFATKVVQLLTHEDLRHKMSVKARSLALNEFSCGSVARRLEGVYRRVLQR